MYGNFTMRLGKLVSTSYFHDIELHLKDTDKIFCQSVWLKPFQHDSKEREKKKLEILLSLHNFCLFVYNYFYTPSTLFYHSFSTLSSKRHSVLLYHYIHATYPAYGDTKSLDWIRIVAPIFLLPLASKKGLVALFFATPLPPAAAIAAAKGFFLVFVYFTSPPPAGTAVVVVAAAVAAAQVGFLAKKN